MLWEFPEFILYLRLPGFSTAMEENSWLPLAADYRSMNVQSELADPHSVLNLYRKLLQYRKDTSA